jgi:hypothetical protein
MTKSEILTEVRAAFSDRPRPRMFVRGTCKCDECLEHEETMQSLTPDDLPLDKLNNPGWDPICFASDEAFAYLMPGLVGLVLQYPDDYIQQFLIHIGAADRLAVFAPAQRTALLHVLDFLMIEHAAALDNNLAVEQHRRARKRLEHLVR